MANVEFYQGAEPAGKWEAEIRQSADRAWEIYSNDHNYARVLPMGPAENVDRVVAVQYGLNKHLRPNRIDWDAVFKARMQIPKGQLR